MDKREIAKLLLESKGKLLKYALNLTWDYDRAYDLLQETALKVLMGADTFNDCGKFLAWAKTIMHHTFINSAKHEQRYTAVEELLFPMAKTSRRTCYNDQAVDINGIYEAIDTLPHKQSRVMRLFISGHKYVEIAVIMKMPLGTVKTNISASRAILKEKLKDYLN